MSHDPGHVGSRSSESATSNPSLQLGNDFKLVLAGLNVQSRCFCFPVDFGYLWIQLVILYICVSGLTATLGHCSTTDQLPTMYCPPPLPLALPCQIERFTFLLVVIMSLVLASGHWTASAAGASFWSTLLLQSLTALLAACTVQGSITEHPCAPNTDAPISYNFRPKFCP